MSSPSQPSSAPPPPADGIESSVRLRILRGARNVFGRSGYAQSSVETILEEAGVSRRTFYRTFKNKEAVLQELFGKSVEMLLKAVRQESANHRDASPLERLERTIEAYIRVHENAGPLARVLLLEQFSEGSPLAQQRNQAMGMFIELIEQGMKLDGKESPDPIVVSGVVAGINQIAIQMATQYPEGGWDVERAKDAMLRMMVVLDERSDPRRWIPQRASE